MDLCTTKLDVMHTKTQLCICVCVYVKGRVWKESLLKLHQVTALPHIFRI